MPPSGYLTASSIESCLLYLSSSYPAICQLVVLPEQSREGRTIRAVKIASGGGSDRGAVLFIGGVHARELVNPDALVGLGLRLCQAYTGSTGLTFGGQTYPASTIKLIVDAMDVLILPLVNPDGRVYVQSPAGDPMWRKNRSPNAGLPCYGVDLNRNYDFLWSATIGNTSSNSCSETFHGPAAFSEPETRNVRWMLDNFPNIRAMMDVHSYLELVLHPWGDDELQTTDPSMNFMNAAYDGLRGITGDSVYREYMPGADRDWFVNTGNKVRDAIGAVNGNLYTVEQAVYLYPTSGTSKDYAYSRRFVDAVKRRVYAYTLETGTEFQPAFPGAADLMNEIMSGLVQFCLQALCAVETLADGTEVADRLTDLRAFRDQELLASEAGRWWVSLVQEHTEELLQVAAADPDLRRQAVEVLGRLAAIVGSRDDPTPMALDDDVIRGVEQLARRVERRAGPGLKNTLTEVRAELGRFHGKTVREALEAERHRSPSPMEG